LAVFHSRLLLERPKGKLIFKGKSKREDESIVVLKGTVSFGNKYPSFGDR